MLTHIFVKQMIIKQNPLILSQKFHAIPDKYRECLPININYYFTEFG